MGSNASKEEPKKVEMPKEEKVIYMPIPEKNVTLAKANSQTFNNLIEEEKFLFEHKNEVLQTQLNQVRKKFEKIKSLSQVIDFREKTEEEISKKSLLEIEEDEKLCFCQYKTYLKINFNFIGLFFVISNLIGVYQLIGILKATESELSFGFKSFLFGNNRTMIDAETNSSFPSNSSNSNNVNSQSFENIFENYSFKTIPDFNLLYLTSIIGNILLKLLGFRFSSIIYLIVNVVTLLFFESFDFPEKYNFYQLLLLIGYYLLLFISVGGISLLPHQIYFDGLTKYIQYKESHGEANINKIEEDDEKKVMNNKDGSIEENIINKKESNFMDKELEKNDKISFFTYLCLTEIPAYLIYVGINYFFKENHYYDYFFIINICIYVVFTIFSLIFYCCYSSVFIKGEKKDNQNEKEINVWRILGYIIYYEKKLQEEQKPSDIIQNNKNKNNNNNNSNELNGIVEDANNNKDKNEVKYYKPPCCYSCRLGHRKCRYRAEQISLFSDLLCIIFSFFVHLFYFCCCFCCCIDMEKCEKCCDNSDLSEINQGDEQFCFCYKVQGKYSWFCDLLFKNEILNYIEFDIFLEIITIGFSKKINQNLNENEFNENFITLIIYLIFFIIFASLNRLESEECRNKLKRTIRKRGKEEVDNQKGNISIITLVNIFFVIIFSGFYCFGSESLKNFTDKYLIILPFALTKFYNFILLNCLINIIDYGNIDLLSNSTIVSLFLLLYKLVAFLITDIIDCSVEGLILFQFIFCVIIVGILTVMTILVGLLLAICWAIFSIICACCCKKDD